MEQKQEQNQEKIDILKETVIEDEKPQVTLAEKLKEKKKKQRKRQAIFGSIFAFLAFIAYGIYWLFKPYMAYPDYGICRTFIELSVNYPHTIEAAEMNYTRDRSMRIWYTHTDAFGELRMEEFRCSFEYDAATGAVIRVKNIRMGKINMDPKTVQALNNALPYFHANPLILAWPYVPDSLAGITFEIQALRKIQFDPKR